MKRILKKQFILHTPFFLLSQVCETQIISWCTDCMCLMCSKHLNTTTYKISNSNVQDISEYTRATLTYLQRINYYYLMQFAHKQKSGTQVGTKHHQFELYCLTQNTLLRVLSLKATLNVVFLDIYTT